MRNEQTKTVPLSSINIEFTCFKHRKSGNSNLRLKQCLSEISKVLKFFLGLPCITEQLRSCNRTPIVCEKGTVNGSDFPLREFLIPKVPNGLAMVLFLSPGFINIIGGFCLHCHKRGYCTSEFLCLYWRKEEKRRVPGLISQSLYLENLTGTNHHH